jgi:predicted RNase H-like nuclease
MKTLGLESCQAGWLAVSVDPETAGYWLLESDEEFEKALGKYGRVFLDVPIGLEDDVYVRECDQLLRERLGSYYEDSIFNPPIRLALNAPTYAEASMISYETTGKKVSTRGWNAILNIRLVNRLLDKHEEYRDKVYESHPELLLQILNGNNTILQKKESKKGLRHRLALLKKVTPFAEDFFRNIKEEFRRNQIEEEDILNATVLAYMALRSEDHEIKTIPEEPPIDSAGLPKAIHYV